MDVDTLSQLFKQSCTKVHYKTGFIPNEPFLFFMKTSRRYLLYLTHITHTDEVNDGENFKIILKYPISNECFLKQSNKMEGYLVEAKRKQQSPKIAVCDVCVFARSGKNILTVCFLSVCLHRAPHDD